MQACLLSAPESSSDIGKRWLYIKNFFPSAIVVFPGKLQPAHHSIEVHVEKMLSISFCYQKSRSTCRWLVSCIWNPWPSIFQENGSDKQQITYKRQDDCLIFWKEFLKSRVGGENSSLPGLTDVICCLTLSVRVLKKVLDKITPILLMHRADIYTCLYNNLFLIQERA